MRTILGILLSLALVLTACGDEEAIPPETTPGGSPPDTPVSVPADWPRGEVFITGTETRVEGQEGAVAAILGVTGDLPTPCAQPQWETSDDGETVEVELWSVEDPSQVCAQVLEPFDIEITLGTFSEGRRIALNDEVVGEFGA